MSTDDPTHDSLYAREGAPCATCARSYMSLRSGQGTAAGFDLGAGLTLRVCRLGLEPPEPRDDSQTTWCDEFQSFGALVPLSADDLESLGQEASPGFLGDLAQGERPVPRTLADLRWYDRGFREGWLPPHRIERSAGKADRTVRGPWDKFLVVGVTPAFGDGHTPAVGEPVLQVRGERTYLLADDHDAEEVRGVVHPHTWWANQVSAGAAVPLERPAAARRGTRVLVLRGGERVLSPYSYKQLSDEQLDEELDRLAEEAVSTARAALDRGNAVVARICAARGLRARPDHAELQRLAATE